MKEKLTLTVIKAKTLLIFTFIAFCLTSCMVAPSPKRQYSKAIDDRPYDVIIVPGLPFENGKWGELLKSRMYWASYLYAKGIAKNVIFSGSAVYSPYVEAEIMALYGEALGIPKENIFTETTAEHSTENLYYSYKLAKRLGFQRIALATDPYQGTFLYNFARNKKIPVDYLPFISDTLQQLLKTDPTITYEKAYVDNFVSIVDRESFFERLKGTRGKKILYEEEEADREKEQVLLKQEIKSLVNSR